MAETNGTTLENISREPPADESFPSLDNDKSKPRDARLLHMVLTHYGVTKYQERVCLQLMDFSYRYTAAAMQDALHFSSEGTGSGRAATNNDLSSITLSALRLSIASRTHYQYNPTLPKEFYNEIVQEKNRVALPPMSKDFGLRLPPEQYCLTGSGFDLQEEWEQEDVEMSDGDALMKNEVDDETGGEGEDGEEESERMEDMFGDQSNSERAEEEMEQ